MVQQQVSDFEFESLEFEPLPLISEKSVQGAVFGRTVKGDVRTGRYTMYLEFNANTASVLNTISHPQTHSFVTLITSSVA